MKNFTTYDLYKLPTWLRHFYYTKQFRKLSEILTGQSSYILENTLYKRFKKIEVGGNTEQDGTPTPENQIPIQNVVGTIVNKVSNKNLFDKETMSTKLRRTLTQNEAVYGSESSYTIAIPCLPNKIYTISHSETNSSIFRCGYITETNLNNPNPFALYNGFMGTTELQHTIETGDNATYILFQGSSNVMGNIINTFQVEYGSAATPYVQHEEQTAEFILLEGQRLMLGDTLEDDGIHHKRTQYVFTGNENWGYYSFESESLYFAATVRFNNIKYFSTIGSLLCNSLLADNSAIYNKTGEAIGCLIDGYLYICLKKSTIGATTENTKEECVTLLKQFLSTQYQNNTPFEIEYTLIEDEYENYTATQQEQYNATQKLKSYKDMTIIESSSDDLSPILTLQYWQKNEETSSNLNLTKVYENNEEIPNKNEIVDNEKGTEIGDNEESEENENESD